MRRAVADRIDITDASGEDDDGGKLQLMKALREGTEREALRFTFSSLKSFEAADLQKLADSLPLTLRSLTLDLSSCRQLANVDGLQGLGGLTALQSLTLNLGYCRQLTNVDGLQGLGGLTALQSLTLDLSGCSQLANVDVLQGLGGFTALQSLTLHLRG